MELIYCALDLFAAGNQKVSMDNWAFHPNRWKLHQPFLREERSAQYSNIKRMHLVHCIEPSAFLDAVAFLAPVRLPTPLYLQVRRLLSLHIFSQICFDLHILHILHNFA